MAIPLRISAHAVQKPGPAAQVRAADGPGKDLPTDVRGMESGDRDCQTSGARAEAEAPNGKKGREEKRVALAKEGDGQKALSLKYAAALLLLLAACRTGRNYPDPAGP